MNLIPKNANKFSSESYWQTFFKTQQKSFEWYADFDKLKPILSKFIRNQTKILHIGCGNSTLGFELNQYGVKFVKNIDFNELVINQMNTKYKSYISKNGLEFLKMNVFDLKFENEEFNIVIDKGTLDSLAINNSRETIEKVDKLFAQIEKILDYSGKYICVSLLQEHILQMLINWVTKKTNYNYIMQIYRLKSFALDPNSLDLPVFVVEATKLNPIKNSNRCLFELCLDENYKSNLIRSLKEDFVYDLIKELQNLNFLRYYIRNNNLGVNEEICYHLYDPSNDKEYKYKLIIVDFINKKNKYQFSIFVVPLGREKEYLFSSSEGRRNVAKLSSVQRLVFVYKNSNYKNYPENNEKIKEDLSDCILNFVPKSFNCNSNQEINILSVKDKKREVVFTGKSEFSGSYGIYDIESDDEKQLIRQLIFDSNKNIIQSEAKLKPVNYKNKLVNIVNHDYLTCNHHGAIVVGLSLFYSSHELRETDKIRILLIGLGGGCLASFLQHNLDFNKKKVQIDIIEIDSEMVNVAKKWFDLNENFEKEKFEINIIIKDGLNYIDELQKMTKKYHIIIFDIDNKENESGLSCPPISFVEENTLEKVKFLLEENNGLFMLNLASRNKEIKNLIQNRLKRIFTTVNKYKIPDETNNVYYCFNSTISLNYITNIDKRLKEKIEQFTNNFKLIVKNKNYDISNIISINDYLTNLK